MGTFLRFYRLGFQSVWGDEAVTCWDASQPFRLIPFRVDSHPPLYFAIVRCSLLLFGTSEQALRLPSAVFGSIAIVMIALLLRRWFGVRAAFLVALLWAVLPYQVFYSQEARMYSLLPVISIASLYYWDRALDNDQWPDWMAFASITTIGLFTHYWYLFFVAGQTLWTLATMKSRNRLAPATVGFMLPAIIFLPMLMILKRQISQPIPLHPEPYFLLLTLRSFSGSYQGQPIYTGWTPAVYGFGIVCWAALMVIGFISAPDRNKAVRTAIACVVAPVTLGSIVALTFMKITNPRYLSVILPATYVIIAPAFENPRATVRRCSVVLATVLLAISASTLHAYFTHSVKGPWRQINECVQNNLESGASPVLIWADTPIAERPPKNFYFKQTPVLEGISMLAPEMRVAVVAGSANGVQTAIRNLPEEWAVTSQFEHDGKEAVILSLRR